MFLFTACAPDPDALLRAGQVEAASRIWAAAGQPAFDPHLPAVDALAFRARQDTAIDLEILSDLTRAIQLLERAPTVRTRGVDVPLARLADLGLALDALAVPPAAWVVGRSSNQAEKDPWTGGGALPWKGGRLVGYAAIPPVRPCADAAPTLAELGARIDADPPPRLVTLALADATGELFLTMERVDGGWQSVSTNNADAAARLLVAADNVRDYGAATLRHREGGGFVVR